MPPPDPRFVRAAEAFGSGVDAVVRRIRAFDVLLSITGGACVGGLGTLIALTRGAAVRGSLSIGLIGALVVTAAILLRRRRRWTPANAARRLERSRPESRNLIVTAEELLRSPHAVPPRVQDRVVQAAAEHVSAILPADVIPLRRVAILCAVACIAWGAVPAGVPQFRAPAIRDALARTGLVAPAEQIGALHVSVTLTPPAYLGAAPKRLEDPERVEAISGTRLSLAISGSGGMPEVRLGQEQLEASRAEGGILVHATLHETTYLAIEDQGSKHARRLIPVVVTPDRAPSISIEQPGKDLLLPDAARTIAVAASARDDFGLASLELRFTKVSGSGEQFEFEEGTIPLQVDRHSERAWNGRTALALAQMKLQPGDALVYRIVGADRRPGEAGLASSDTFFVEIAGPDQVTLAGFELPPDRERYALSQQMILLEIQRLRAREKTMAREAVAEDASAIAVEQRSVRANFIFLTGGHVEDEEEEAAHSHEIQEGRLEHNARREINDAIQHMSRAEQGLIAVDTAVAEAAARAAVDALQRAFGRNRYLLRSLPVRSRLDPSRRLSGDLEAAGDARRTPLPPEAGAGSRAARSILMQLMDIASSTAKDPRGLDSSRLSGMAERALAVDAASAEWQQISNALARLRDSIESGRDPGAIREQLAAVMRDVRAEAQRGSVVGVPADTRDRQLRGAWGRR